MKHTLSIISPVLFILLFMSGCSQSYANVSIDTIQKTVDSPLEKTELTSAVATAANGYGWEIVQISMTENSHIIELKKQYVKYKRQTNRAKRWKKIDKKYDVNTIVKISDKSLVVSPTEQSISQVKKYRQQHIFNDEIAKLEKVIQKNLLREVL